MNIRNIFKPFSGGSIKIFAGAQLLFLVVIWFLAPTSLFPSPVEVITAWHYLATSQGLLVELGSSAWTITQALIYSSVISAVVAYLAAMNILRPVSNGIASLRFLGFAGITFLFTMLTSDGNSLKVWLLTFGMSVFQVTNMVAVTNSITQAEVDYSKTLRFSGFRTVYELLIRGKLHEFLDIIRQNAAIGWVMLSMVEGLVRSEGGIGSLLINQSKYLNISAIFAIQLTILGYGIIQDGVLGYLRLLLCPYVQYSTVK
jgi:ABC-type nitrate/sulfonate/bicarbonate transport system permease component